MQYISRVLLRLQVKQSAAATHLETVKSRFIDDVSIGILAALPARKSMNAGFSMGGVYGWNMELYLRSGSLLDTIGKVHCCKCATPVLAFQIYSGSHPAILKCGLPL